MSHPADVFSLLDRLLPPVEEIPFHAADHLHSHDEGIVSLRNLNIDASCQIACYSTIRNANPFRTRPPSQASAQYARLRAAALDSDPDALNDLGWLWLNGCHFPGDPQLAQRLFKLAAVQGSAEALFNLGMQAQTGIGVPINPNLAIDYLEQAFAQGILCAARLLGYIYRKEIQDDGKAHDWYMRAIREQDLWAAYDLGCMVLYPRSPKYDQASGVYWLQWAAMQGHLMSCDRLIGLYDAPESPPDPDRLLYRFWHDHYTRICDQAGEAEEDPRLTPTSNQYPSGQDGSFDI